MRPARSVLVAVALLLGWLATAGVSAAAPVTPVGQLGIRLLDAPTSERGNPRASEYIIDQLTPGAKITRRVAISNTSKTVQRVAVYAAAASVSAGEFHFADGTTGNELTSWIGPPASSVLVPVGKSVTRAVTITVPSRVSTGERYAVIWAEVSTPQRAGAVTQISRVGIRVYLYIAEGNVTASRFDITRLTAARSAAGLPIVTATVRNTGLRALDVAGTLALTDGPAGLAAPPAASDATVTIGPAGTEPVTFTLGQGLPAGPWLAKVSLSSGLTKRQVSAHLTFPTIGATTVVAVEKPDGGMSPMLWSAIGVAGLLVLAGAGWLVRRRLA